jgi:hypothetical protein
MVRYVNSSLYLLRCKHFSENGQIPSGPLSTQFKKGLMMT